MAYPNWLRQGDKTSSILLCNDLEHITNIYDYEISSTFNQAIVQHHF
jgi:hypothetical protein